MNRLKWKMISFKNEWNLFFQLNDKIPPQLFISSRKFISFGLHRIRNRPQSKFELQLKLHHSNRIIIALVRSLFYAIFAYRFFMLKSSQAKQNKTKKMISFSCGMLSKWSARALGKQTKKEFKCLSTYWIGATWKMKIKKNIASAPN